MSIKSRLKELLHKHKYTTLVVYPPHNTVCDLEQCRGANTFSFMLRCNCGFHKPANLPPTIETVIGIKGGYSCK